MCIDSIEESNSNFTVKTLVSQLVLGPVLMKIEPSNIRYN